MQSELPKIDRPRLLVGASASIDAASLLQRFGFANPGPTAPIVADWQILSANLEAAVELVTRQNGFRLIWIIDTAHTYLADRMREDIEPSTALIEWNADVEKLLALKERGNIPIEVVERIAFATNLEGVLLELQKRLGFHILREGCDLPQPPHTPADSLLECLTLQLCRESPQTTELTRRLRDIALAYSGTLPTATDALELYRKGMLPIIADRNSALSEVESLLEINNHLAEELLRSVPLDVVEKERTEAERWRSDGKKAQKMVRKLKQASDAANVKNSELRRQLREVRDSRSWRLTAPLRNIGRTIKLK